MPVGHMRQREAVLRAIREHDRVGRDAFLDTHGYGPRTRFALVHEGRLYDPKAILGVAHGYEFPEEGPLGSWQFAGGAQTNNKLRGLGFEIIEAPDATRLLGTDSTGAASDGARAVRYWTFAANPGHYDVVRAIEEDDIDWWTTAGRDIRTGDRVVVWKFKGNQADRGVVALAEVLSDPEVVGGPRWEVDPTADIAERVKIRYVRSPALPLWLGGPSDAVLRSLSVSRATGGSVFNVTVEQWDAIVEAAGGWTSAEDRDVLDALRPRQGPPGQGRLRDICRRLAVERYAVDTATDHYVNKGWKVEDVGLWRPYDLDCVKGSKHLHVEVKGTTGKGEKVILTANEVTHAETCGNVALFVVTHIDVSDDPDPKASGGQTSVFQPWVLNRSALHAKVYDYDVGPH